MHRAVDIARAIWQLSLGWLFCLLYVPVLVLVVAAVPGDLHRASTPLIRVFGKVLLAICGVRLKLEDPEALLGSGRRILILNHTSTLDLPIACAAWPKRGSSVLKKEFRDLPVLGWASAVLGQISVDRSSTEAAKASLNAAATGIKDDELGVFMAPEGTRSVTGEIGRFKLGAWHLASAADAPIVPLVLHGTFELWPHKQLSCRSGTVTVRVLESVYPAQMDPAAFRENAEELRQKYVETLATMRRDDSTD